MPAVTLKAHYDGKRIILDEPFEIPPNSPLMVTVLPATEAVVGEDWILAAQEGALRGVRHGRTGLLHRGPPSMTEGDVVLTPLPQADGQVKNRPEVVLRAMPPHGDLLVCGVSTQLQHETPDFDEIIRPGGPDLAASGLKAASLIHLGFLAVLPVSSFLGSIGSIASERHGRLLQRLSDYLVLGRAAI